MSNLKESLNELEKAKYLNSQKKWIRNVKTLKNFEVDLVGHYHETLLVAVEVYIKNLENLIISWDKKIDGLFFTYNGRSLHLLGKDILLNFLENEELSFDYLKKYL